MAGTLGDTRFLRRAAFVSGTPVMTRLIRDNYASSKRKRGLRKFIETSRRDRTSMLQLLKLTKCIQFTFSNKIP